ncbi:MAG: M48 family metallopeptidase [Myxococcales bacterium]|nr:M48 family metallopeptidase [Myxococcales bacterium]
MQTRKTLGMRNGWIRARAVIALLLVVVFYVSAAAMMAGLVYAGLGLGGFALHLRGKAVLLVGVAALACFGAALVVFWSLLPRWQRFVAPGPELLRDQHPKLFREIDRVAAFTGQQPPVHVYLVPEVNAFVTERGGVMGFFSTRVMGLGLGVLSSLSVAQVRGVLAHEFGHFAGGDVKLLPWINKARAGMLRTLHNLASAGASTNSGELAIVTLVFWLVQAPFAGFAKLYLRFTQSLSRAQEIAADTLAVSIVGSETHAAALTLTERAGLAYSAFLRQDVEPLLATGRLPPLGSGFAQFLSAPSIVKALDAHHQQATSDVDPYDSHPPLAERLAHAAKLNQQVTRRPVDDEPALTLLADVAACELTLAKFVTERDALLPVSWEASGDCLSTGWRQELRELGEAWAGVSVAEVPRTSDEVRALLERGSKPAGDATDTQVMGFASRVTWLGLSALLIEVGFTVRNLPGQTIQFSRGSVTVNPVEVIDAYFAEAGTREVWVATWTEAGIADRVFPAA